MKLLKRFLSLCLMLTLLFGSSFFKGVTYAEQEESKPTSISILGGGLPKGTFFAPTYLNVEQQRLYVADSLNNRIQAFIRGNVFQLAFGGFGQNEREFDRVGGICSDGTNVFVVDSGNSRIQVFDSKSNYKKQFGSFGTQEGHFRFPTDIASDNGKLFVLDTGNNRVQIFDLTGTFISMFGSKGSGNGEFNSPLGIEIAEGKIIVSDTGNNRIQIFDLAGVYQTSFGWFGTEDKAFMQPKGLAYDDGSIYVVDSGNKRIQAFTLTGVFVRSIKLEGLLSPYGIGVLDKKIIVSDIVQSKIYSLEMDGKIYGYFGSMSDTKGRFVKPSSITTSDTEIYVLDTALKTIQVFAIVKTKEKGIQVPCTRVFLPEELAKAGFINPISLVYYNEKIYVVDEKASKISIFSSLGKYMQSFGKYGSDKSEFVLPTDVALFGSNIFVTDSGNSRIQIFDLEGNFIRAFGTYGTLDGQFLSIKGVTVQENKIYIADSGNSRVQIFDFSGNFIGKFGKKGYEIGSYFGLTGLHSDSSLKIYVTDTLNNRVQMIDTITNQSIVYGKFGSIFQADRIIPPSTKPEPNVAKGDVDFDYSLIPGSFVYPSDIATFGDYLLVSDTFNSRVQVIPFTSLFQSDTIRISPSYLDYGSISAVNTAERKFLIHNESGALLEGSIVSDNPAITVTPTTFKGYNQEIFVKVNGASLEKGKQYNSKITITFKSGVVKTVDILIKADDIPDFYTEMNPMFIASADEDGIKIPITIIPQNGFIGNISFIALGLPKNTASEFQPTSINVPETTSVILNLRPSGKFVEAGIYDIEIEAKSTKGNITHRVASTFIYKQKLDLVPHTVLGELFTAIWCLNCVYSHYAMDRLFAEMGKEKVAFIEYYVDSVPDQATVRLAWIESEQRMKWYMSDKGIPDIFFDGTDHIKGIPNLNEDTIEAKRKFMYDAYKKKIIEKATEPSLVTIAARSVFDSNTQSGKVTAAIKALDNIPFRDPRIYFALIENDIPYTAINGDKYHYFVLRDFVTPANDNLHDYLGTPMKLTSGETFGKKGDFFTIDVDFKILPVYNLSNMSLVIFVQDNVTKKVLQTQVYPVKVINNGNFDLISNGSLFQKKTKGEEAVITTYIRNSGTLTDSYEIGVLNKSKDKWIYKVYMDDKEQSNESSGTITLDPEQIARLDIKVNIPGNSERKADQQFFIQATSITSAQSKSLSGLIEVVDSRPPDFQLKVEKETTDPKVLAGDTVKYKVVVTPDPVFDEPIKLSLKAELPEIESYVFEPLSGKAPFSSTLTLVIKGNTPSKDLSIVVLADGSKVQKMATLVLPVEKNPDAVAPSIDIAYPPENLVTNKPELEITGMTDPTVEVSINQQVVSKEGNGSFTMKIVLKEGQNAINFVAKNRKGLLTEVTRIVTLDTKPPSLTLEEIPAEVIKDSVIVTGKTEIGSVVKITTTTSPSDVVVDKDGRFSFPIKLEKGYNTIEVEAIDIASNSSILSIDIRFITLIKLRIGSKTVSINLEEKIIDAEPYIKAGRTMVPIRFISEALGAKVDWNPTVKEITITRNDKTIRLRIGSKEAFIKEEGQTGETKEILDAPPELMKGRTFVPLRFVASALGSELNYDSKLREITIKD